MTNLATGSPTTSIEIKAMEGSGVYQISTTDGKSGNSGWKLAGVQVVRIQLLPAKCLY